MVLLAALLTALLAPFAVRHGLRAWLWWAARREGLSVQIARIEAPFLQPVTLEGVHLAPAAEKGRPVELEAQSVSVDLNFRGWLFGRKTRLLHAVTIDHLRGKVRQGLGKTGGAKLDWPNLHRVLPDSFRLDDVDLDVKTPATAFVFRGVRLSASEVESGTFFAHQIYVVSPILRKSFTDLRGATSWERDRLTIAGLSLAPGLDLEALTADLSRLPKRQVGLEFELDTFGGTLRASFEGRGGGPKFEVALTGSAANISLAQISSAAGLLEPLAARGHRHRVVSADQTRGVGEVERGDLVPGRRYRRVGVSVAHRSGHVLLEGHEVAYGRRRRHRRPISSRPIATP